EADHAVVERVAGEGKRNGLVAVHQRGGLVVEVDLEGPVPVPREGGGQGGVVHPGAGGAMPDAQESLQRIQARILEVGGTLVVEDDERILLVARATEPRRGQNLRVGRLPLVQVEKGDRVEAGRGRARVTVASSGPDAAVGEEGGRVAAGEAGA